MSKKILVSTFLLYTLVLLLLSACKNENGIENSMPVTHISSNTEGSVLVRFNIAPPSTDNSSNDLTEEGVAVENRITSIRLLLFNSETKSLIEHFVFNNPQTIPSNVEGNSSLGDYFIEDVLITPGTYDIFAIANFEDTKNNLAKVGTEKELLSLVDEETYLKGAFSSVPRQGVIMTNRAKSNYCTPLYKTSPEVNEVSINLERSVAKIQISKDSSVYTLRDPSNKPYAQINLTNFKIVNINKCYYLFRHTANLEEEEFLTDFDINKHFEEYDGSDDFYVIDPHFFEKKKSFPLDSKRLNEIYNSPYMEFSSDNLPSIPPVGQWTNAYILENTEYKTSQLNAYSTGIVFKGWLSPTAVWDYNLNYEDVVAYENQESWTDSLFFYNYKFYASLQALKFKNNEVDNSVLSLSYPNDEDLAPYNIKLVKFNQGVYEVFYTYWIRHLKHDENADMRNMEFAVVRNNIYKIKISNISGIGSSEINTKVIKANKPHSYVDVNTQ